MPPLPLFRRFILRALAREKARSLVAVLGIAAGVAVMVAIRLANSSVTDTFKAAVDSVGGETSIRIRGVSGRFDEDRLLELGWLDEYGQQSPVIEAYGMLATDQAGSGGQGIFPRGELLQVLGVDVLLDFDFRDYHVLKTGSGDRQSAREVLALLKDPNSVVLTEKFLRRHGLRVGDSIRLVFASTPQDYRIRGVLLNKGPAKTLDGNFALMDIAAAQLAAGRLGLLDHLDLRTPEGVDREALLPILQERLPTGFVAELPDAAFGRTDTMISAFQFNLEALSSVALIVGLFLIYNTLAISVAARRNEIGILQAVGAGRRMVLLLFLGEAVLLTIAGLAIGLPLGRFVATYAVQGAAQTVETFYIAGVAEASADQLRLGIADVLGAVSLIVPLAMLAAMFPAWDAASTPPVEAVREAGAQHSRRKATVVVIAAMVCFLAGWLATMPGPIQGKPLFGFAAELLFLAGGALLTPVVLWAVCGLAMRVIARLITVGRTELRLAASNLRASLPRVSISVAALAVSLSMMVAIAVMVGSFRETMTYWLESALSADLAVKPVIQSSATSEARLSPQAIGIIESDEAVEKTLWITSRQIPYGDQAIRLGITRLEPALEKAGLLFKEPKDRSALSTVDWETSALVSESYSLRFNANVGDTIELPTDLGTTPLVVAGVYYDYASNQGTVLLDATLYERLFAQSDPDPAPSNLSLYLKPGADANATRQRIIDRLGDDEQLYCVTNAEIRGEALRIFESTFTVTYALQVIAIVVAGLGVASTLITLIYHRQREIGLLSLVGATARQVKRVILWEAVVLGAASQLIGIGMGLLLAYVLVFVINVQSFGWTIQFHLPWSFLGLSTLTVVAASALFGLYPAVRAASVNPLQTVREL